MLLFILGVVFGTALGVFAMSLFARNARERGIDDALEFAELVDQIERARRADRIRVRS